MRTEIRTLVLLTITLAPACRRADTSPSAPAAATTTRATAESLRRLSVDEVMTKIEHREPIHIYDNNSRERYQKGHVPSARWVSFSEVTATDLPMDPNAPLVFYCGSEQCTACHTAALRAIELGHRNVSIMPAGIRGWISAGKPVEQSGSQS